VKTLRQPKSKRRSQLGDARFRASLKLGRWLKAYRLQQALAEL